MFSWQPGQEYNLEIDREGEIITLSGTLEKATATSESLVEDENANNAQIALRKAWLKG